MASKTERTIINAAGVVQGIVACWPAWKLVVDRQTKRSSDELDGSSPNAASNWACT